MMREKGRLIGAFLLALTIIFAAFSLCAEKNEVVVLRLGTDTAPDSHESRGARYLADLAREKSGGTLAIQTYANAQLGTMRERNENMRMGTMDMGTSSVGFLSEYEPVVGIFDLPYLYQDKAHEMRVFDGPVGQEVNEKLQAKGLRVLCYFDAGARQITNNVRPVYSPADLKGMRIRTPQSQASMEGFRAFRVVPVPLPFGELYAALEQGVADGQENPISLVFHNRFYEVQKYLALTNHQLFIQVLLMSEKSWRKLSPLHQRILLEAAKEAQDYERKLVVEEEEVILEQLRQKGMQINAIEQPEAFVQQAASVRALYVRRLGEPARSLFERIDALRR